MMERNNGIQSRTVLLQHDLFYEHVLELIREGKQVTIPVKGWSMRPFLRHQGDHVVLDSFDKSDLIPGKIVLAKDRRGRVILHRIVSVSEHGNLILMGDGNIKGYELVIPTDVAGVVTFLIRRNKQISVDNKGFTYASRLWCRLLPLRPYLLFIYNLIDKIKK